MLYEFIPSKTEMKIRSWFNRGIQETVFISYDYGKAEKWIYQATIIDKDNIPWMCGADLGKPDKPCSFREWAKQPELKELRKKFKAELLKNV